MRTTGSLYSSSSRSRAVLLACLLSCAAGCGAGRIDCPHAFSPSGGMLASVMLHDRKEAVSEPLYDQEVIYVLSIASRIAALEKADAADVRNTIRETYLSLSRWADDIPSALQPACVRNHYFAYVPRARLHWTFVLLHGAGGNLRVAVEVLRPLADAYGVAVILPTGVPSGRWDAAEDAVFVDAVVDDASKRFGCPVKGLLVGGISNGAAGAVRIAAASKHSFGGIVAVSGWLKGVADVLATEGPPVFAVHGGRDGVIPLRGSSSVAALLEKSRPGSCWKEYTSSGHLLALTEGADVFRRAFDWFEDLRNRGGRE